MVTESDRRGGTDMDLDAPVAATLTFTVGHDEVELDGIVLRATARTVVVELSSGVGTLMLATTPTCELVLRAPGFALRAEARPGHRVQDVPDSRQVELVILDETVDLRHLL